MIRLDGFKRCSGSLLDTRSILFILLCSGSNKSYALSLFLFAYFSHLHFSLALSVKTLYDYAVFACRSDSEDPFRANDKRPRVCH